MKPSKKNINATRELIKKYRSITLEKINEVALEYGIEKNSDDFGYAIANIITGFGTTADCSLCESTRESGIIDCRKCILTNKENCDNYISMGCITVLSHYKQHRRIKQAKTPKQLLSAFQSAVGYLEKLIKKDDNEFV